MAAESLLAVKLTRELVLSLIYQPRLLHKPEANREAHELAFAGL